jgi:Protein of unknown function (DUF3638)
MIGSSLIIFRREGASIQEYIPTASIQRDLPSIFSTGHSFWYSRNTHTIAILPLPQAWIGDGDHHWTVDLRSYSHKFIGRVKSKRASGVKSLIDRRSEIHRSLVQTLAPLEPDPRGILVTLLDGETTISAHLPRHDLSFAVHENELQCLSLPGYVVDVNLAGIGCLVGLKSVLNLRHSDIRQPRRKVIVPKGSMVLAPSRYGHVDISIEIGDSKGYFVYDVDDLVGRLVGTRTMESDLYLTKLHAFTSSSQPDLLTQRSGTDEALDLLASAAAFSFYTVSKESRSCLDDIATLTPLRTFYPHRLRVMETVEWANHLSTSAQRPEFRSMVVDIIQAWQGMEPFLHQGDLAKDLTPVTGMEYLTYRAAHRDWVHSSSIVPEGHRSDFIYKGRDSLNDSSSRSRESTVFQVTRLACNTFAGIPPCRNILGAVSQWTEVTGVQTWGWDGIENWLSSPAATPVADTWCTFYELCRQIQSPRFDVSVALAFQRFRGVPMELIGTLVVVLNYHFSSSKFDIPRFPAFELANGSAFNRDTVLKLVKSRAQSFKQSDEYLTAPLPTESNGSQVIQAQQLYQSALEKECNQLMDELSTCWPTPPSRPLKTSLRLLKPSAAVIEDRIRPLLNSWSQNRDFLLCIQKIQDQVDKMPEYEPSSFGYSQSHPTLRARSPHPPRVTLETLMAERAPGLVYKLTIEPLQMTSNRMSNHGEDSSLRPLIQRLRSYAQNALQKDYANNLDASLEAYEAHLLQTANGHSDRLDEKLLDSLLSISIEHSRVSLAQVRRCLSPNTAATQLMQEAGLWPTVTTKTILQLLSLKNRRTLTPSWSRLLIFHAISIHEVKRMGRLMRLAHAGMESLLESELQYTREWDPSKHPDWLLVEIEADLSIRPTQAAIAKEMLKPKSGLNSVMQLNMGEGKSSVS